MNTKRINNKISNTARILVLALVFGFTIPAQAAEPITREQAISAALERTGGATKVLGVEKITKNSDAPFFAVKLMVNGRVKVVRIPAEQ